MKAGLRPIKSNAAHMQYFKSFNGKSTAAIAMTPKIELKMTGTPKHRRYVKKIESKQIVAIQTMDSRADGPQADDSWP